MKIACFIPIKANSERVPGKNLRILNGRKLYEYVCQNAKIAGVFDDIFVDTNSAEIAKYAEANGFHVIQREKQLAENTANGNDLILRCIRIMIFIFNCLLLHLFYNLKQLKNVVEN